MVSMIRTSSLRGFVGLADELGGDAPGLLARFGLTPQALADDDSLIPIATNDLLLDVAAREWACPDLGLRLAESQDITILGPLAVAIESSSSVADALACASRFIFVHSPALRVGVEPDPRGTRGVVCLTYRKDLTDSPYSPQAMELGLGLFHRIAVLLLGDVRPLRSVEIPHAPISPVARYTGYFGADVRFDAPVGGFRVEERVLDRQFQGANVAIRQLAIDHLARNFADPNQTDTARVRRVMAESLGATLPTIDNVARLLALHPRTLQRRLAAEGTTFEAVLDELRRQSAIRYLTTTDLPMAQIAAMLSFSEQSALSRAVRRWCAASPREVRARAHDKLSSKVK